MNSMHIHCNVKGNTKSIANPNHFKTRLKRMQSIINKIIFIKNRKCGSYKFFIGCLQGYTFNFSTICRKFGLRTSTHDCDTVNGCYFNKTSNYDMTIRLIRMAAISTRHPITIWLLGWWGCLMSGARKLRIIFCFCSMELLLHVFTNNY